ncbi:MAG: F0F1 ATP synthase subunit epsilon [Andreesenia angusta]|nr:F0F1 ATP synthase subunit epsilon [Andreesenia angusta]
MSQFLLEIITPERKFFEGDVERVVARSISGDIAILANHIPLVTPLEISILKIKAGNEELKAAISSGYMEVSKEKTTLIVDAAEWPDDIDLERAEAARQRAEERLRSGKDTDVARAEMALNRAINRISAKQE